MFDARRLAHFVHTEEGTGIYIRAKHPETDQWGAFDIVTLTSGSLLDWLTGHGGDNPLAENTIGVLLGHGHLHTYDEEEE